MLAMAQLLIPCAFRLILAAKGKDGFHMLAEVAPEYRIEAAREAMALTMFRLDTKEGIENRIAFGRALGALSTDAETLACLRFDLGLPPHEVWLAGSLPKEVQVQRLNLLPESFGFRMPVYKGGRMTGDYLYIDQTFAELANEMNLDGNKWFTRVLGPTVDPRLASLGKAPDVLPDGVLLRIADYFRGSGRLDLLAFLVLGYRLNNDEARKAYRETSYVNRAIKAFVKRQLGDYERTRGWL